MRSAGMTFSFTAPDEPALSMTGARFHADAVDHHIGAFAFADLLDPLEDVLFCEIDDVGGAGLARHGDALRHGLDRDDTLRAQNLSGLDREQTDGTRAPDRHDLTAPDAGLLGGLIACGKMSVRKRTSSSVIPSGTFMGATSAIGTRTYSACACITAGQVGIAEEFWAVV